MSGCQFNVPLPERYALALTLLATRDETTVPATLRPAIERFLDLEMQADPHLRAAVDAMTRSRKAQSGKAVVPLRQQSASPNSDP